jgi:antitoxin component of MazEF toxin-antitoxin module
MNIVYQQRKEPEMPVVCKHGNSLSIRISAHITRLANLKAGDYVNVRLLDNGDIRVRPTGHVIPADSHNTVAAVKPDAKQEESKW